MSTFNLVKIENKDLLVTQRNFNAQNNITAPQQIEKQATGPLFKDVSKSTSINGADCDKVKIVNRAFHLRINKENDESLLHRADKLDMGDELAAAEYQSEIYKNMRSLEAETRLDPNYLSKVQLPSEVKDTSRAFLVEWIIDVHRKFRLQSETLYVTVRCIDRFLSKQQIKKS